MRGNFDRHVVLKLENSISGIVNVSNVIDAAECLTFDWPVVSGSRYQMAQDVCLAVLDGKMSEDAARHALILAAEEANVPVLLQ